MGVSSQLNVGQWIIKIIFERVFNMFPNGISNEARLSINKSDMLVKL